MKYLALIIMIMFVKISSFKEKALNSFRDDKISAASPSENCLNTEGMGHGRAEKIKT